MTGALRARVAALIVSILTAVGLAVTVVATNDGRQLPPPTAPWRAEPGPLAGTVTADAAIEHLHAFQDLADAHGGNRAAGTPGFEASTEYVEQTLHEAGYETTLEHFTFEYDLAWGARLDQLSPTPRSFAHEPMAESPSTAAGGLSGEVVAPADPTGCTAASYPAGSDGKIALVARGDCPFAEKSVAAGEAGAIALVVYNNEDGPLHGGLDEDGDGYIPTTGITQADGEILLTELGSGPVTLAYDVQHGTEERESFSVLAETTGGDPEDVVMLGAHLDSTPAGPGINDNASGVAALLEVAVQLADRPEPPTRTVRFAFWGAEELGLIGSTHYVEGLQPAELDALAMYLNVDMVASPNYMIGVYAGEASGVLTSYLDAHGQPWVSVDIAGASDHAPFQDQGVPVTGLYTGSLETKDDEDVELFGGTSGESYDAGYHTAGDDIDNISIEALQINLEAIAHVVDALAGPDAD